MKSLGLLAGLGGAAATDDCDRRVERYRTPIGGRGADDDYKDFLAAVGMVSILIVFAVLAGLCLGLGGRTPGSDQPSYRRARKEEQGND